MQEQWNNTARRCGQRAHIKAHAPVMGGKRVRIWDETVMGKRPSLPPADYCPNMDMMGRDGGDTVTRLQ
jgi:hypothetical protein